MTDNDDDDKFKKLDPCRAELAGKNWSLHKYINLQILSHTAHHPYFLLIYAHLIRDICLLFGEFVVVSQLMIFHLELLGLADKPMAGPSSSKGKILR